jgi:threonine/homoserine/homoserine lactone efflux protein
VDGSLLTFLGVAVLVIVTPGPDTALTIRSTLLGGRAAGVSTALGVATGQLVWVLATSAGLVAVLLASEPVFRAVKLAGAVYLIVLGAHALCAALRGRRGLDVDEQLVRRRLDPGGAYRHGVLSNLGNPKMAVFFASILPQFAPEGHGMLSALVGLGLVFSALTLTWLTAYAIAVSAFGRLLHRSAIRRAVEALAGALLIALGVRLATEAR